MEQYGPWKRLDQAGGCPTGMELKMDWVHRLIGQGGYRDVLAMMNSLTRYWNGMAALKLMVPGLPALILAHGSEAQAGNCKAPNLAIDWRDHGMIG